MIKHGARFLLVISLTFLFTACGQSGALYLPPPSTMGDTPNADHASLH
ncbi:MAG: hypothetical protein EPO11_00085 [Gammaproteobacteria bacterium]|nr:MAG: hypothetical protein EPO11_00085 [Gammaproteobacteria bacterium]